MSTPIGLPTPEFPVCAICKADLSGPALQLGDSVYAMHYAGHARDEVNKALLAADELLTELPATWAALPSPVREAAKRLASQLQTLEHLDLWRRDRPIQLERVS